MHYCPSCKTNLPDNVNFCSHCGYALGATIIVKRVVSKKQLPSDNLQTHESSTSLYPIVLVGEAITRYCQSCKTELPNNAHSCTNCGHTFETTTMIGQETNIKEACPADIEPLNDSPTNSHLSILYSKVLGKLPMSVQDVIAAILTRARDPKPEEFPITGHQKVRGLQALTLGWLPMLTLMSSLGVLSVAYACTSSRNGASGSEIFFWLGLLLIFVPAAVGLISPVASRFERIGLLSEVGICLYLVKVITSPLYFSAYDEFLQWRTADNIARSNHLFSNNPLLPVSPFYPGLEIVTNALSVVSGLSTFTSGVIVVGVGRLVMILALFMLYELVTQSARLAGIAMLLYMANPHFLFFDAAFSYESLALPLATFMLFALARHEILKHGQYQTIFITWIALGAVVVTHHVTDFIFDGFLLLWMMLYLRQRYSRTHGPNRQAQGSALLWTALFGVFMSLAWISLNGNPVVKYLSSYFADALNELGHILSGSSNARHLFVDYAGGQVSLVQRIMVVSSVILISLGLPFGLLCLWQRYRHNTLSIMLGIVSLFYPCSQVFRLTNFGSEVSDRSSAFLFISIAYVLAILITQFWPTRGLNWMQTSLITCAVSVMFIGGFTLGSGAVFGILPGPYLVTADARSIEPEGIQAARWTYSHLGPDNRLATDRINQVLMLTYGEEHPVNELSDQIDPSSVFFSNSFGPYEMSILQDAKVHYLVVDLRLSKALPLLGFYFDEGEPDAFQHTSPIELADLTKFSTLSQINCIFDSGDIVIYDVGGLINLPKKP